MLAWLMGDPLKIKPLWVSKLNTAAQIVFACVVLGSLGFDIKADLTMEVMMAVVTCTTLLSIAAYVVEWMRHMNSTAAEP